MTPLREEVEVVIKHIEHRAKSLEALLEEVCNQATFAAFVRALAKEREKAVEIENANPQRYMVDGALGWKNADIASFLYAGLSELEDQEVIVQPSWAAFANFFYFGKIIE